MDVAALRQARVCSASIALGAACLFAACSSSTPSGDLGPDPDVNLVFVDGASPEGAPPRLDG